MKYALDPDYGLKPIAATIIEVVEAAAEKAAAEGDTEKQEAYEKAIEYVALIGKFKYDKEWWG